MKKAAKPTVQLRVAAVWGTNVLAIRLLSPGESLQIGDGPGALVARPDGTSVPEVPIRAAGAGFELDPKGALGGTIQLRGRYEDPAQMARSGAPVPIVAGDSGLVQYGRFALFFQFTDAVFIPRTRPKIDFGLVAAFFVASFSLLGGLAVMNQLTPDSQLERPLELTSHEELMRRLRTPSMPTESAGEEPGGGKKDKDKPDKAPSASKKMARQEGRLGKQGVARKTELPGQRPGLGGMAEALSGAVGEEMQETLGQISSVAAALGGLGSDSIVLGQGSGTGLLGSGPGGGGDGPGGVPYGSGTLGTGLAAGDGSGEGSGRGLGNGSGSGEGAGASERKLATADAPPAGSGLSKGAIARVVQARSGAFRACYESAAARNPKLRGTVSVSFQISPGGGVQTASIAGSSLGNTRVEGCVLRQFKRLRFPAADKGTGANWSFAFKPSQR